MIIEDGTGSGKMAKVNSGQRLYTRSVSNTEGQEANFDGDAYNINTGYITLTNATETPILYVKNNEDENLMIDAIAFGVQPSTGGSSTELAYATVVRNPTGGTIISNETDVDINSNRNYGSQNTATVDAYKGATGDTLSGGGDHIILQLGTGRAFASINEILEKGSSLAIKFKPPTGNTSVDVYAALIYFFKNPTE